MAATASERERLRAPSGPRVGVQPRPPLDPYPLLRPGVCIVGFAVKRGVASTRVTRRCWAGRSLLIQSRPPILPPGLTPGPDGGACRPAEWGVVGVCIRWGPFGSSGLWGGMGWSPPLSSSAKPTMQTPGRRSGYGSREGRGCTTTRGPDGAQFDSETPNGIEGPASRAPLGRGPRTGAGRPARADRAGRGRPAGWARGLTALAIDAPRPGLQGWVSYAESGGAVAEKLEFRVISQAREAR